jgi:hypothetical protein
MLSSLLVITMPSMSATDFPTADAERSRPFAK